MLTLSKLSRTKTRKSARGARICLPIR